MPGFNLSIGSSKFPVLNFADNILTGNISGKEFSIDRYTLNKFQNDKIFFEDENIIIVLEGVVLNNQDLMKNGELWAEAVIRLYKNNGDAFFGAFKGSFSGVLHDKNENKWLIFTDQIGSKHIYYSTINNDFLFTSEIKQLYKYFKENGLNNSLNEQAAYMLLSYGYMLDDNTLCSDIKKLLAGHYIKIEKGKFSLHKYFSLPENYDGTITEEDAIENIDYLFRDAIKLQFEKDREYGYKHIVSLSGGLDSRMTTWVAHEMGYTKQLNFTFSQSNYLDETIAKQIALDLKHEWIFKALDNGLFLEDIDESNDISGGNVLYYGLAHVNSMLKYINFGDLGMVHTGQLGDVVIGSYLKKNKIDLKTTGAYSKTLIQKVNLKYLLKEVFELENNLIYQRGFNGINSGLLVYQKYTESNSPFLLVDILNYCLSIPISYRINHQLYFNWIKTKYPNSTRYIWEKIKRKPGKKQFHFIYKGRSIPLVNVLPRLLEKTGLKRPSINTKNHMNPLYYWYNKNSDLKKYMDNYFYDNLVNVDKFQELQSDCKRLYINGNVTEKLQVITLLNAIKKIT